MQSCSTISELKKQVKPIKNGTMSEQELDAYLADLIVKRSQEKNNQFTSSRPMPDEEAKIPNTNKRFLASTIRNTNSFNESLSKTSTAEVSKKRNKRGRGVFTTNARLGFEPENSHLLDPMGTNKHLQALVSHSKLRAKNPKKKSTKDSIISEILGYELDEGVYGPLPGQKAIKVTEAEERRLLNGEPNSRLPSKCPW